MNLALRGAAALAVAASLSTLAVGVAEAAPTGKVVAQTQKMTGPSLKTTQEGWYPAGTVLTLQCYERGQSVKGALSKYHPNGGWDDLWYKTSDGHFVADIDIETGSNNTVTDKCGDGGAAQPAPAPAASSSKVDNAINWAMNKVGSQQYDRLCSQFVQEAYGLGPQGNAIDWYRNAAASGQVHTDMNYPRGAIVFSSSYLDGGLGHVLIALGGGKFVSGGVSRTMRGGNGSTVQVLSSWNPTPGAKYLGWIAAPA